MKRAGNIQGAKGPVPIWELDRGERVTTPGVYSMPIQVYHGDCCDGPSMSSSGLRRLWKKTPAHYFDESPHNPNRLEEDENEARALRIGRAAHTLLLEPQLFKDGFKTRPVIWDSWRTKDAKAWRDLVRSEGVTILEPAELQTVHGIVSSLREHPLHREGILDGDLELSLIWRDPPTGLWLKSRPDAIPTGSNILADLKCLRAIDTDSLSKAIYDAGYDMQLALCGVGMKELLGREVEDHVLVTVENVRPHATRVVPIPADEIGIARLLLRGAINLAAKCFKEGHWPAYESEDSIPVYRRANVRSEIEARIEVGTIPRSF